MHLPDRRRKRAPAGRGQAHHDELEHETAGKSLDSAASTNSRRNHVRIGACLEEASLALTAETGRPWALSRDHHYQMSNRFGWAWKLADFGVPVVLVYLGFLGCDDMAKDSAVIATAEEWQRLVKAHSASIVPPDIWDQPWQVHGRVFVPLIRVLDAPLLQRA